MHRSNSGTILDESTGDLEVDRHITEWLRLDKVIVHAFLSVSVNLVVVVV